MKHYSSADIVKIARFAHEINRAYCKALGDDSQVPWEEAPDWQKVSTKNGVKAHLANPDMTPEDSHANWLEEKLNDGWEYGEEKDVDNKLHPCIAAYEDLPEEQRAKDYLFKTVVDMMR